MPTSSRREMPGRFSAERLIGDIVITAGFDEKEKKPILSLSKETSGNGTDSEKIFLGEDDRVFSENMFNYSVDLVTKLQGEKLSLKELSDKIRYHVNSTSQELAVEKEYYKNVDPETGEEWSGEHE